MGGASLYRLPESAKPEGLEADFLALAGYVARNAGRMKYGLYKSPKGMVSVKYAEKMEDGQGGLSDSPARVDVNSPYIEISKGFVPMTVAMRMFVLCHEFGHYLHHSFDELLADRAGAVLYLKAGFPRSEAFYALADLLGSHSEADARMKAMHRFLTSA